MAIRANFTGRDLRVAAGERSFQRGRDYLDAVDDLEVGPAEITAVVHGTDDYEVVLTMGEHGPEGECDCPWGQDGNFRKHLVAVGLAVLSRAGSPRSPSRAGADRADALDAWLRAQSRDELVELVRELIADHREVRRVLHLRAAQALGDPDGLLEQVRDLLTVDDDGGRFNEYGLLGYREALALAGKALQAADVIRDLIEAGHGQAAQSAAAEAIATVWRLASHVDDSSGGIGEAMAYLAEVHAEACQAVPPDGLELADWLAGQLLDNHSLADLDLEAYDGLLDAAATARLHGRIAEAWRRNPAGWHEKYLMEHLVRASGGIDALVAVLAANLDQHGHAHLKIAEEFVAAGRPDDAADWAERGLTETAEPDSRLADFLATHHLAAGRPDDALVVRRGWFAGHRTLAAYESLRDAAGAAAGWQEERPAALELLRADASDGQAAARWGAEPVLISALISDRDFEGAWHAAESTASRHQWERLAQLFLQVRPDRSLEAYSRLLEPLRSRPNDGCYLEIARLLEEIRVCHRRLNTSQQFDELLAAIRSENKRRTKLLRILDIRGLSAHRTQDDLS